MVSVGLFLTDFEYKITAFFIIHCNLEKINRSLRRVRSGTVLSPKIILSNSGQEIGKNFPSSQDPTRIFIFGDRSLAFDQSRCGSDIGTKKKIPHTLV